MDGSCAHAIRARRPNAFGASSLQLGSLDVECASFACVCFFVFKDDFRRFGRCSVVKPARSV